MLQLSMPTDQSIQVLRRVLFLRNLDDAELLDLASSLTVEDVRSGDIILEPSSHPDALRIIISGVIDVLVEDPETGEDAIASLTRGDTVGEVELVFRQQARFRYRALTDAACLRWERKSLTQFMKKHAAVLDDLRFLAQTTRLARAMDFPWMGEEETIFGLARKHSAILYQHMAIPLLLIGGALILVGWGASSPSSLPRWLGIGAAIGGILFGIWQWLDWRNDYYIVTDQRAVWLEKIIGIYDSRREAPLHTILSVSVGTDMGGRALGFGDVVVRTYTGEIVFRDVGNPHAFAALIEEHWRRIREEQDRTDRDALEDALQRRLSESEPAGPETEQLPEPLSRGPADPRIGLDEWGFKIRFEEGGVITYRKHWAVLLRSISISSMLILLVFGLMGLLISGIVEFTNLAASLACLGTGLIPLGSWWLYQYADWVNDLYQITPTQIIDLNKRPLAREERKVAPIENILGTEVDRKGILGMIFNYGDVIANVGTTQFNFKGVFDPVGVQQDIVRAQADLMKVKTEAERRRRRDEMVELFEIYHDQYAPSDEEDAGDEDL